MKRLEEIEISDKSETIYCNVETAIGDREVNWYSQIDRSDIAYHSSSKAGSKTGALEEIVVKILFRHAHTDENVVNMEERDIKIKNMVTKKRMSAQ